MSNDTTQGTDYFDGVVLDVPSVKPPIIEKLKANARARIAKEQLLDADVVDWMSKQDSKTIEVVNASIRQMMVANSV